MTTTPGPTPGPTPVPTPATVSVPGATVAYAVRGDLAATSPDSPALVLFGSPMDSTGFDTLASHFPDRVVVTYDPRNTGHSQSDDPTAAVTAEQHAADLHAVVTALDTHPVDLFASSGGAVNALAMLAQHPGGVRTLVAHEPPAAGVLPDREAVRAAVDDMLAAYDAGGTGPMFARFITLVSHRGEVTADHLARPAPDPSAFGLPGEDDGRRDDPLVANLRGGGAGFSPDVDALQRSSARVVVGVGEDSGTATDGEMAGRAAHAVAAALGQDVVVFPGGHAGFLGGEFGQHGKPEEFAARLREVLAGSR